MAKNWFRIIGRAFVLLMAVYGALSWLSQFHLESIGPAKAVAYWENADGVRIILRADDAHSSSSDLTVACLKDLGYNFFEVTSFAWLNRGRFTRQSGLINTQSNCICHVMQKLTKTLSAAWEAIRYFLREA